MDNVELIKNGRILALKFMAEAYLQTKGKDKLENIFPRNIDKNNAELNAGDVLCLHHYLVDQYDRVGLDLNKMIEATGEQVVPGKLASLEIKELVARADEFLAMMTIVKQYKEANRTE